MMKKKGEEILLNQIVFIVIIIVFTIIMITFVTRYGNQSAIKEEKYAKQIALAIDKIKPGTSLKMDVSSIYEDARKNGVENPLRIDNNEKKVVVRLTKGEGYFYNFFNNPVAWNIDDVKGKEKLIISLIK